MRDQLVTGTVLGNRFKVVRSLAKSGQAQVYQAQDELTGVQVVLKAVLAGEEQPLIQEFSLLSQLRHPNIVRVEDLLDLDGRLYLVERFVEGADLVTWAAQDPDPARLGRAMAGALRGLQFLHARQIIHRDLKPENLLVTEKPDHVLPGVKLIDFGLATQQPAGETVGTVEYAAPEVLAGKPATRAADIYSLGIVIYQALHGSLPPAAGVPSVEPDSILDPLLAELRDRQPSRRPTAREITQRLSALIDEPLELTIPELLGDYFPHPPLMGRKSTLEQLQQMLLQVRAGGRMTLHLSGFGKTIVARRACVQARLLGMEVVAASSLAELLAAPLLARTQGDDPSAELQQIQPPGHLATVVVDRLLALSETRALLICLDGWSERDPLLGELLNQLVQAISGAQGRYLVLCSGTLPEQAAGQATPLQLRPLTHSQVTHSVQTMLHHLPPASWMSQVGEVSGGDPRLVVELVRAQIEAGLPDKLVDLPDLEELARQRIASLHADDRQLVASIALSPRPVPPAVLKHLVLSEIDRLPSLLDRGLLTLTVGGEVLPASRSFGQAALEQMDPLDKMEIHRCYGQAWSKSGLSDPGSMGHHLLGGEAIAEGVQALLRAPCPDPADLTLALERLGVEDPSWSAVQARLARVHRARGELDRALLVADQLGSQRAQEGLLLRVELLLDSGHAVQALEHLHGGPPLDSIQGCLLAARGEFLMGHYEAAIQHARQISSSAPVTAEQQASIDNIIGLSRVYLGQVARGRKRLIGAIPDARRLDDPLPLARLLNSLGIAHQRLGELDQAVDCYSECLQIARRLGDLRFASSSALNLGTLFQQRLQFQEALDRYRVAVELARRADVQTTAALAAANEANLLLFLGDLSAAQERLDQAETIAELAGATSVLGHISIYRAELLTDLGDDQRAAKCLKRAESRFDEDDAAGRTALILAEASLQPDLERLQELQRSLPFEDPNRWRLEQALGEVMYKSGALDRAIQHLELALALGRLAHCDRIYQLHASLALCYRAAGGERKEEVAHHARRARSQLDALLGQMPHRFRQLFVELPRVRQCQQQLEELSEGTSGPIPSEGFSRLLEINKQLTQQTSTEELLKLILQHAIEITGAERGFILLTTEGDQLRVAASLNVDHEAVRRGMKKFSRTIARVAVEENRPLLVADAAEDERFGTGLSIHGLKLRSVLCVPLRVGESIRGALYVDNRFQPDIFQVDHVLLLSAFADQAGLAFESARLLQQALEHQEALARAKAELQDLNHKLEAQVNRQAQELDQITVRLRSQEEELVRRYNASKIVGRAKCMRELFKQMDRVSDSAIPVFIWGESGTGKELVARAIHYNSPRADHPFVAINCGAMPGTLLESQLFGHARGAFTGAMRDQLGLFEVAGQGTLFLDEVGDMPPEMQVKLLRVLQEGTYRRIGEERERTSRCRILSASLHKLEELLEQGTFREDLFYRLNVITLHLPPLRQRREDIPRLIEHFLSHQEGSRVRIAPSALAALVDHHWPGNVRQLENELQRAALLADETIQLENLSPELRETQAYTRPVDQSLQEALQQYERQLILDALGSTNFHVSAAAKQLGLHRVALHRKMRKYGIRRSGEEISGGA